MYNKFIRIWRDFYKTAKLKEIGELHGTAFVLTFILIAFCMSKIEDILTFASKFNDSALTITSLLGAFGIATITILLTSSSDNIRVAKGKLTKRKDINNKEISYFKLLVIRSFYNLLLQLGMLFIAVIYQVLLKFLDNKILLYIEVFMLLNMLLTQIFVVISLYHLLSRDENEDDDGDNEDEDENDN
ncbi:hypothetical protein [Clostridium sp. CF012]|uniref:hypothetical protein n=1 Tax=Clostridium sp. CF012 TaxID=2843319 RepID=UPI001C0AEDE3|nr:hypothetical protein [Clostridium sp. CF012]MBU3146833.1 hypothetical protein [Clostridium sp. CF012]